MSFWVLKDKRFLIADLESVDPELQVKQKKNKIPGM
jgi:hypothetical protein